MYNEMFDCMMNPPTYEEYNDTEPHGTGVVEILSKVLLPKTELYVAKVDVRYPTQIITAMLELVNKDIKVINCSFVGDWKSNELTDVLEIIQSAGVIVVAAAGNDSHEWILTDLNNGKTVIVGSHNFEDFISGFSDGKCMADICSFGEEVYLQLMTSNARSGTSYAAAFVTGVTANYLSLLEAET